jgi:hypothetical protein
LKRFKISIFTKAAKIVTTWDTNKATEKERIAEIFIYFKNKLLIIDKLPFQLKFIQLEKDFCGTAYMSLLS